MKKKIIYLLLVANLMLTLSISAYAITGAWDEFDLDARRSRSLYLYSEDMDRHDDDLHVSLILEEGVKENLHVSVIDETTREIVAKEKIKNASSTFLEFENIINYKHDYKVKIVTWGNEAPFSVKAMAVID